jgi:hypothetical protein
MLREVPSFVGTSQDRSALVFDNDVYFAVYHRNATFQSEFAASTANTTRGTVVQVCLPSISSAVICDAIHL